MCRVNTLSLTAFSLALAAAAAMPLLAQEKARHDQDLEERIKDLEEKVRRLEELLRLQPEGKDGAAQAGQPVKAQVGDNAEDAQKGTTLRVFWDKGLKLETPGAKAIGADAPQQVFKLKIGGRIQNDWAWIDEDESIASQIGGQADGTEFRRARLYISGDIYQNFFFKAQYDFAGGDADFKDVFLGVKNLPLIGNVKVGHFKEPFSLEELTSSKYLTFMERGLGNLFAPSRNAGVSIYNHALGKRLTWAAGVFRDSDDFGLAKVEGDLFATFRLTGLPVYRNDGSRLLHLGLAYSLRSPAGDTIRLRGRPEVHLADRFLDTGRFGADNVRQLGLEGALVLGRFSLQSEYFCSSVDSDSLGDPAFWGFYAYGSFFLTKGDQRNYKQEEGVFDRVSPEQSFFNKQGQGAWEIAFRYSRADLNDALITGGELSNFTSGLNWYLNPNTRVMFNYVFADLDQVGDAQALMTRFQVDF